MEGKPRVHKSVVWVISCKGRELSWGGLICFFGGSPGMLSLMVTTKWVVLSTPEGVVTEVAC